MYTLLPYIFLSLHVFFALFILFLTISFLTGGPFVPSRLASARAMIDLANIKPGMKIYDLGSGDGRILLLAARKGARAVGFDINPFLVLWAKLRALLTPHRNHIVVQWKNFWQADFSNADVVFVYLLPLHMEKLQKLLQGQLKPGSIVVTNTFIFLKWKAIRQDKKNHVYVFRMVQYRSHG